MHLLQGRLRHDETRVQWLGKETSFRPISGFILDPSATSRGLALAPQTLAVEKGEVSGTLNVDAVTTPLLTRQDFISSWTVRPYKEKHCDLLKQWQLLIQRHSVITSMKTWYLATPSPVPKIWLECNSCGSLKKCSSQTFLNSTVSNY
jgi:hypothetical protein